LNYVKAQLETKDDDLKNERRKAASLEREYEQYKFSNETKLEETDSEIDNLVQKVTHLQTENKDVHVRIEELIKEH
jgi:predicted transcriptional regulator